LPSGSSGTPVPDLPAVAGPPGLTRRAAPSWLPGRLGPTRRSRASALAPAALPLPRLAAVEFGAELVAAALPAFGDLLDGVADGLEPVQLARPGAPGLGGPGRALPGP
jgi:hypothetical protein